MSEETQVAEGAGKTQAAAKVRGRRQVKVGTVTSAKPDKTVLVRVESTIMHRLYHRYMKRTKNFMAHDENNECSEGDLVSLVSIRPLSKRKRWKVQEILKRAQG